MMEYDGDLHLPRHYLVSPPQIERTMGQLLAATGVTQLAISETQKYGHVTYFWNGNKSGMFDEATETYVEIPSDQVPFEQRPWMKAAEITDRLIASCAPGATASPASTTPTATWSATPATSTPP
jgi:2,3-bisphosphoglycerate-independent phosphoglycerate mutase